MSFLRHLAALMLVVTIVVVGGLAWEHFGASTLAGGFRGPVKVVNVPGNLLKGLPPGTAVAVRPGPHGPVVVVLGLAWNHFAASTLVGSVPSPLQREIIESQPHGRVPVKGPGVISTGDLNLGLTSMLDPVNLPVLRHTVVIEAGAAAAVGIIDLIRRRWRRARRAGS